MQIPMEILSTMMTTTGSGSGVRQSAGNYNSDGARFDKMFENALEETQAQALSQVANNTPGATDAQYEEAIEKPIEEPEEEIAIYVAAGAITNQEVVFILEGDKESTTTPEMRVEPDGQAGKQEQPEITVTKPIENFEVLEKPEKPVADVKPTEQEFYEVVKAAQEQTQEKVQTPAQTIAQGKAPEELHAQPAVTANAETQTETVGVQTESGEITGEVMARTPIIRTSERQGNEDSNSEFAKSGGLSPLENDNDTVRVKGQREPAFSETMKVVEEKAENTQEQVITNNLPLADGIAPERFQAEQQIKQAAMDAPVRAENLFDEMVSRLETMKTESQQTMTIHLKPEFLGRVALELAMDAAGLHLKINAADSGVRAMINGQLAALIESLENKGIEVVDVEVAYTGVDNGSFKESKEDTSKSHNKRRTRRETEPADGVTYYTTMQPYASEYYLETGVSSVEYSA